MCNTATEKMQERSQSRAEPRSARLPALAPLVGLVGCVLLGCCVLACRDREQTRAQPNIVVITLDTTRADHLGPYGYEQADTPHLDELASRSTVFDNAYATSSWTLPSHASMFTGVLPMVHGAQSAPEAPNKSLGYGVRPLGRDLPTLAELLGAAGYRTGAVIAGPALRSELGTARGFDVYRDELDSPARRLHGKRAETVTDEAIEIIESAAGEPYFLFVNYFDAHSPYRPPAPFDRGLAHRTVKESGVLLAEMFGNLAAGDPPVAVDALPEPIRRLLDEMRRAYDAEIHYMDHHLGRLLQAIREAPGGEDTLIIVTADHGESFGEHFYHSHGANLYEDNVRVPLIVYRPGVEATRISDPTQNHRIFSTALEAAGLEIPESPPALGVESEDPIVLEVQRSESNIEIFGELLDRDLHAVQTPPWKLIDSSAGTVELFDLESDPGELHNRAEELPGRVEQLRGARERVARRSRPRFDSEQRAELRPETEEALRALGYIE